MSDPHNLSDFLHPVNLAEIAADHEFEDGQIGKIIEAYEHQLPDLRDVDLVIVGCGEERGNDLVIETSAAPDAIREQLYFLYYWHPGIRIADIGNIKTGATLADTYAALKTVLRELIVMKKKLF